ncbi:MAG: hypothetical protein AB7L09_21430 [Nitrospira sp.]
MVRILSDGSINMLCKSTEDVFNVPMMDITLGPPLPTEPILDYDVELKVKSDGKVIWVNLGAKCVMRICGISGKIVVEDGRSNVLDLKAFVGELRSKLSTTDLPKDEPVLHVFDRCAEELIKEKEKV